MTGRDWERRKLNKDRHVHAQLERVNITTAHIFNIIAHCVKQTINISLALQSGVLSEPDVV